MNTIIRNWMPRQAAEAERFTGDKYQLMHIEMFPEHIIHAECLGGEIDLICNRRVTVGFSRSAWRFVDGESCTGSAPSGLGSAWQWWTTPSTRR